MKFATFRIAVRHYLLGLLSASWNGGIGSVAAVLGVSGAGMAGVSEVRILNWHEMVCAFVGAFVVSGVFWLKAHPLPENWETIAPWGKNNQPNTDK